jgi:hypothetical protein
MDTCHVFHFSGNPQLVSMLGRLFCSCRGGTDLDPAWFALYARSILQRMIEALIAPG